MVDSVLRTYSLCSPSSVYGVAGLAKNFLSEYKSEVEREVRPRKRWMWLMPAPGDFAKRRASFNRRVEFFI